MWLRKAFHFGVAKADKTAALVRHALPDAELDVDELARRVGLATASR